MSAPDSHGITLSAAGVRGISRLRRRAPGAGAAVLLGYLLGRVADALVIHALGLSDANLPRELAHHTRSYHPTSGYRMVLELIHRHGTLTLPGVAAGIR